jgi:CheY-like chemotaxis protein
MAQILIVDDDEDVRRAFRRVLEREGHDVREAENGQVGLQLLGESPAHLVIADLFMPVMDGLEFISKLQKQHPRPKVLAISGSTYERQPKFLEIAGRMEGVETLAKPVTNEELLSAVHDLLAVKPHDRPG